MRRHLVHQIDRSGGDWDPVKDAAPASAVAVVRSIRQSLMDKKRRQMRSKRVRTVASIAMRRVNHQAEQHRAHQPCNAGPYYGRATHAVQDKSQPAGSPTGAFDLLFAHPPVFSDPGDTDEQKLRAVTKSSGNRSGAFSSRSLENAFVRWFFGAARSGKDGFRRLPLECRTKKRGFLPMPTQLIWSARTTRKTSFLMAKSLARASNLASRKILSCNWQPI
jgi:hypothetical protein